MAAHEAQIALESFAARETYIRVCREALSHAKVDRHIKITAWPPVSSGRSKGDAVARSAALLQRLETGTVRLAGYHPELESAACQWESGKHRPDSLAALVVVHDVLVHAAAMKVEFALPHGVSATGTGPPVTSMEVYLAQRIDERPGGGYDPMEGYRGRVRGSPG